MDKEKFKRYAEIKNQIKSLEAEAEELNEYITKQLVDSGSDKVKTEFGDFTLSSTSRWKYSEAVGKLQEDEKRLGIAEKVSVTSLRYTTSKKVDETDASE